MGNARSETRVDFGDGLRAVAISLVVASHLPVTVPHVEIHEWGGWAVNCFFVLTGFLLARPYLRAALDPTRPFPSTRLFLMRRFLRIYPLYAASVFASIMLFLVAGTGLPWKIDILAHLTMLHGLLPMTVVGMNNAPLWTMPVDAAFYLAFPIGAYVLCKAARRAPAQARVGLIVGALCSVAVGGVVARILVCGFVPAALNDRFWRVVLLHNAVGFAPAFCIGIGLALFALRSPATTGTRRSVWIAAAAAIGLAALLRHMSFGDIAPNDARVTLGIIFYDPVAAVSVGALVYVFICSPRLAHGLLGSRLLTALGGLAYAVYLFHYPILFALRHTLRADTAHLAGLRLSLLTLAVTFIVAYVAHRFIERPFLELKERKRENAIAVA